MGLTAAAFDRIPWWIYWCWASCYESYPSPHHSHGAAHRGPWRAVTLDGVRHRAQHYAFVGISHLVGNRQEESDHDDDFAIEAQAEGGMAPEQAIFQAGIVRFRTIMRPPEPR